MFTGIVKGIGVIKTIRPATDGSFFSIAHPLFTDIQLGASVAIDGACLTVIECTGDIATFQLMEETFKKTMLGDKEEGSSVNIELSLHLGDEMGGHMVSGHVDGVGEIVEMTRDGDGVAMTVRPPKELLKYMVTKGSVAIDGVSLTIARVSEETITIFLVEYTLSHTTLGKKKAGDRVNVEADMMAKYVERLQLSRTE